MDMVEFGHHASDQTNPTQIPAGVIKISDKEARDRSTIPYIDPNPVPFTTLRLSTPPPSSGPGGTPFIDNSISQQEAIQKAQSFLTVKVDSIVEKPQIPPSGNKHDFFSLSPYYWPDPNNPKGPYILKDGHTNPESTAIPDKQNVVWIQYRICLTKT
jgi:Alginate lyase